MSNTKQLVGEELMPNRPERKVIGLVLQNPASVQRFVSQGLTAEDFSDPKYAAFYSAILELHEHDEKIGKEAIIDQLATMAHDRTGWSELLNLSDEARRDELLSLLEVIADPNDPDCWDGEDESEQASALARQVIRRREGRDIAPALAKAQAEVETNGCMLSSTLRELTEQAEKYTRRTSSSASVSTAASQTEAFRAFWDTRAQQMDSSYNTGYTFLDSRGACFEPSQVSTWTARTGVGKTLALFQAAMIYQQRSGNTVGIFELELSQQMTFARLLTGFSQIHESSGEGGRDGLKMWQLTDPMRYLLMKNHGDVDAAEREIVELRKRVDFWTEIYEDEVDVVTSARMNQSVVELCQGIETMIRHAERRKSQLGLVVVDTMTRIRYDDRHGNAGLNTALYRLEAMARREGFHLAIAAQQNRDASNTKTGLHTITQTDVLGHIVDWAVGLERAISDDMTDQDANRPQEITFRLLKNRGPGIGREEKMSLWGARQFISPIDQEDLTYRVPVAPPALSAEPVLTDGTQGTLPGMEPKNTPTGSDWD